MTLTGSTKLTLGVQAPDFKLFDASGKEFIMSKASNTPATVIVFMCNHCPYVKHLKKSLAIFAREYKAREVAVIGINPDDAEKFPEDGPSQMTRDMETFDYTFPYLVDSTQEVAKAYQAICTPDFYVFDDRLRLAYRGQFDDSRPGNDKPVTGNDLRSAVNAILDRRPIRRSQAPSVGCSIKWKANNAPDYSRLKS